MKKRLGALGAVGFVCLSINCSGQQSSGLFELEEPGGELPGEKGNGASPGEGGSSGGFEQPSPQPVPSPSPQPNPSTPPVTPPGPEGGADAGEPDGGGKVPEPSGPKEVDYLAALPKGAAQLQALCARGNRDPVSTRLCATPAPVINGLVDLQRALGIDFKPGILTTGGQNPRYAITGHSSSLVVHNVNAINPRAIIFTTETGAANPNFTAMGFTRGEQFVELVARDAQTNALSFFLLTFRQPCNDAPGGCTNYDLLTPKIEAGWTGWTVYQDTDLKNTALDCLHCHQPQGPAGPKLLRMQELRNPWTHWFRNGEDSNVLRADYLAAHGADESYAGIPGAMISSNNNGSSSNPQRLEDIVRQEGFGVQPNEFPTNPTQAQWMPRYTAAVQGQVIPPPYFEIRVTDPAKLTAATQNYRDVMAGTLPPSEMMDIRRIFNDAFLPGMSLRPAAGLDGRGILTHMCQRCHNPNLDQTISRARFDVTRLDQLPRGEKDLAIARLRLPDTSPFKMPPVLFGHLSPEEINLVVQELMR